MPAPSIVQHKANFASAVTTVTTTLTSNVTAGHMVLVFVFAGAGTINTPTMTGETFAQVTGASNTSNGNNQMECFATNSAVGGAAAVTATITGATDDIHCHVMEISGQAASPQDATGNTASTTASVSTSASTTTANDLVIAFFSDGTSNVTYTPGTGYSQVDQTNNGVVNSCLSESKTVSATGVQTATATGTGTDTLAEGIIAIAGTVGGGVAQDDDGGRIFISPPVEMQVSAWR